VSRVVRPDAGGSITAHRGVHDRRVRYSRQETLALGIPTKRGSNERVWTLAALSAVALFVGASPAGAAHIDTSSARARLTPPRSRRSRSCRARGRRKWSSRFRAGHGAGLHRSHPHRIVLDVAGARLGSTGRRTIASPARHHQHPHVAVPRRRGAHRPRYRWTARLQRDAQRRRDSRRHQGDATFAAWHSSARCSPRRSPPGVAFASVEKAREGCRQAGDDGSLRGRAPRAATTDSAPSPR